MDNLIPFKWMALLILLVLSAFLSGSEAALFSLTPLHLHKMAEDRYPFLGQVRRLLQRPKRLLITLIVGNEMVNIILSVIAASLFIQLLGAKGQWVSIVVTTVLLLLLGEATPKTFAVLYPMLFASFAAPFLTVISRLESPVVWGLERLSEGFLSLFNRGKGNFERALSEDEFKTLIDIGQKAGTLEESQRDLIHRVFELGDMPVSEIMVPRVEMFCLPLAMSLWEMEKEIIKARHERIPIYGHDRDDILGIIYARDVLSIPVENRPPASVKNLLKKAYIIPESRTAGALLLDFQKRKLQMAIVVDEYGGVSGLATLEDIIENLFSDVYEGYGVHEPCCQKIDEHTLLAPGNLSVEDFNAYSGTALPADEFDTLGGFVFHLFGKLPVRGESVSFEDMTFRVEKMVQARIVMLRVERKKENGHG